MESVGKSCCCLQAYRVQALACVFAQAQPKGCTLYACSHGDHSFPDSNAGVANMIGVSLTFAPAVIKSVTHHTSFQRGPMKTSLSDSALRDLVAPLTQAN